ncbi:MAG: hypothetical protein IPI38_17600 [Gemmatimonadetes bacterium]|nr:hypothetical protein [Gemmatimonadota bacterium]
MKTDAACELLRQFASPTIAITSAWQGPAERDDRRQRGARVDLPQRSRASPSTSTSGT